MDATDASEAKAREAMARSAQLSQRARASGLDGGQQGEIGAMI